MKTKIIIFCLLGLILLASNAYAETGNAENVVLENEQTGVGLEIHEESSVETAQVVEEKDVVEETGDDGEIFVNPEARRYKLHASGAFIDAGIGYSLYIAAYLRLSAGYHFHSDNLDALSFGLFGEVSGILGLPVAVNANAVPMFFFNGESFRVGFGLGVGTYKEVGENVQFELEPELRLDWFTNEHFSVGIMVSVPLILCQKINVDAYSVHVSEAKKEYYMQPWMMLSLNFGYSF